METALQKKETEESPWSRFFFLFGEREGHEDDRADSTGSPVLTVTMVTRRGRQEAGLVLSSDDTFVPKRKKKTTEGPPL